MSASDKYYMIGEVMELTGATREMLRNYIKKGLINPIKAGNNYSLFSDEDVRNVVKIMVLDELGLDTKSAKAVTVSRSEMREALIKNNYDLSSTVKRRSEELKEVIIELIKKYFLSKLLAYDILLDFNDEQTNEIKVYAESMQNNIIICDNLIDVIFKTFNVYWNSPIAISFSIIEDKLRSALNYLEEIKEKEEISDEMILDFYEWINVKHRFIPEKCISLILQNIYVQIKDMNNEFIKSLCEDGFLERIFNIISEKAKQNYEELQNSGEDVTDKTPLYEFFEKIINEEGDKEEIKKP